MTNQVVDMGLFDGDRPSPPAHPRCRHIDVCADRGYFKIEDSRAAEGRDDTLCSPTATGSSVRTASSQGRVPLRRGARCICVSGGRSAIAEPRKHAARFEKVSLHQSGGVPACPLRVRCTTTANRRQVRGWRTRRCSTRGGATEGRPWVLDGGAEGSSILRPIKQWMFRALSHQGLEKVSRRVQPDGRLPIICDGPSSALKA